MLPSLSCARFSLGGDRIYIHPSRKSILHDFAISKPYKNTLYSIIGIKEMQTIASSEALKGVHVESSKRIATCMNGRVRSLLAARFLRKLSATNYV